MNTGVTAIYLWETFLGKKYEFERQIKHINNSDWYHMLRDKSIPKAPYPLPKLSPQGASCQLQRVVLGHRSREIQSW